MGGLKNQRGPWLGLRKPTTLSKGNQLDAVTTGRHSPPWVEGGFVAEGRQEKDLDLSFLFFF